MKVSEVVQVNVHSSKGCAQTFQPYEILIAFCPLKVLYT